MAGHYIDPVFTCSQCRKNLTVAFENARDDITFRCPRCGLWYKQILRKRHGQLYIILEPITSTEEVRYHMKRLGLKPILTTLE